MGSNMTCKVSEIWTLELLLKNDNIPLFDKTRFIRNLKINLMSLRVLHDMKFGIEIG